MLFFHFKINNLVDSLGIMMKVIIAGSRNIEEYGSLIFAIKQSKLKISTIISGTADGVDKLGERYGKEFNIPVLKFPADWETYGKSAGYKRNLQMAENADALIALWDGKSKGTKHMINIARKKQLKVFVFIIRN